jgi:hypothetical protein
MRRLLGLLVLVAACSGDPPDPCAEAPTYDPDIKALVATYCIDCHAKGVMGGDRMGAPVGLDFDDYATLMANLDDFADAFTSGVEPPRDNPEAPPATSGAEREIVNEWRRCGYPEN